MKKIVIMIMTVALVAASFTGMAGEAFADWNQPGRAGASGTYVWPVPGFYTVTEHFAKIDGGTFHNGIDISAPGIYGAAVVAADSGVVNALWYNDEGYGDGYGIYCMIDHDGGRNTCYAHLSEVLVTPGQYVFQGQVIGYVGSTGDTTAPHLHFETRLWNTPYDPMSEF